MQLILGTEEIQKEKVKSDTRGILTSRDVDISKFLLEMKFASVEEIHKKFFKVTLLGLESRGFRAAWKRLNILEELGFIKALHHFQFLKRFYIPTSKAYHLVQNKYPDLPLPYPSKNIDIRTFEHDLKVTEFRINIENSKQGFNWISDKLIRCTNEYNLLKQSNLIPDGIYINSQNEKICFEYEKSVKAKARYQLKIKAYVKIMRSIDSNQKLFDKALYVCENLKVFEFLTNETKIYGDLFKINYCPPSTERGL